MMYEDSFERWSSQLHFILNILFLVQKLIEIH
jgi:hypothetical protein